MLMRIATVLDASEEDTETSSVSTGMNEIILAIRRYCRRQIEVNAERRKAAFGKKYPPIPNARGTDTEECPICIHPVRQYRNISCGHKFCTECLDRWYVKRNTCPICKSILDYGITD